MYRYAIRDTKTSLNLMSNMLFLHSLVQVRHKSTRVTAVYCSCIDIFSYIYRVSLKIRHGFAVSIITFAQ